MFISSEELRDINARIKSLERSRESDQMRSLSSSWSRLAMSGIDSQLYRRVERLEKCIAPTPAALAALRPEDV